MIGICIYLPYTQQTYMKYTKFIIENYKGIDNLTLDFEKQPYSKIVTLVGLNESGKTSILEAINFYQNGVSEEEAHKLIPKKHKINFTGSVKVTSVLTLTEEDNNLLLNKIREFGYGSIRPVESITILRQINFINSTYTSENNWWNVDLVIKRIDTDIEVSLTSKDNRDEWLKIVCFIRDELRPKILYYPDFLFNFPDKIYIDKAVSNMKKQGQFRDIIQDILTSIDSQLTIDEHLIERLRSQTEGSKEALDHTLSKMSHQVTKVVLGAWKNIMNIAGKEFLIEAKSENRLIASKDDKGNITPESEEVYYLQFRLKEGTEKYFVAERSLGFKWFFTFLLFTEFRKNRATDIGETLFLLDEPASNLHSTAQRKLLAKFEELTDKSRLIYTTHSHHLINPRFLSGTYIVKNLAIDYKNDTDFVVNSTDIDVTLYKKFVSENPDQQDYYQPVLDALDHQPGLLEKIEDIVITEGKFDYFILKYINEIILKEKYLSIRFYPGNGADANSQIIRLYIAWNRNFKIILDGDKAGKNAKDRYIKNTDYSIGDKIFTLFDADSTLTCPIEEVFTAEERLRITQRFDDSATHYNKSKFNTAIQTAYLNKDVIHLTKETIEKFEKIFNLLK